VDSKRSQPLDPRWRSARAIGSQGQLRTLALALRLAEFEVAASGEHEAPLLLLDDLSSELDHGRMERLVRHLETLRCQIAMSTTDPSIITRFGRGSIRAFRVAEGMVAGPPSPG
jgi:DNA replication and repair protein RecF